MAKLSGHTKQALAVLLDQESDHKMIDSLYQRFDVKPLSTANGFPTKLKKATHLGPRRFKASSAMSRATRLVCLPHSGEADKNPRTSTRAWTAT